LEGKSPLGSSIIFDNFKLLFKKIYYFRLLFVQGAWELIAELTLLPSDEDGISAAVESYHALSDEIQQIFHHVLLKTMECLCNLHSISKNSIPGSPGYMQATIDQILLETRNRAKCLVSFSSFIRINNANEVRAKIGNMEAFMI